MSDHSFYRPNTPSEKKAASTAPDDASFGVGRLIGQSFSIFFRNFFKLAAFGLVSNLVLIGGPLLVLSLLTSFNTAQFQSQGMTAMFLVAVVVAVAMLLGYAFTVGVMIQLAFDSKLGRPVKFLSYVLPSLKAIPAIFVLGLCVAVVFLVIMMVLGSMSSALTVWITIPLGAAISLLIYVQVIAMPAACVIERSGLYGLSRSFSLTRGYFWPVAGAVILSGVCNAVISFGLEQAGSVLESLAALIAPTAAFAVQAAMSALVFGTGMAFSAIVTALIYARLREIKEGIGLEDLAAVFD